ncbi:uncharacterized protein JCM6883_002443 [Sporobolomyces salmoneus]|uniref:uncharacterized protein n=1 Tax=Sporobolomyces salmoneus TaxID=183962 RepID=UPI0031761018
MALSEFRTPIPISRSIPLVLAPSSRPSSPSTFDQSVSLLSARLVELDQARRKSGLDHLASWNAGLARLESTVVKGKLLESPWTSLPSEGQLNDEELNRGIPINMEQWQEWEDEKKLMNSKRAILPQAPQSKRRKHKEQQHDNELVSLTRAFVTSKPQVTASKSSNSKPRSSISTPRLTPDSKKSASFPSLETINSAGRSPSPLGALPGHSGGRKRRDSWKSGGNEGGAEEEILFDSGPTQAVLPTSSANRFSSQPRISPSSIAKRHQPQLFLSSPPSLSSHRPSAAGEGSNPYTSTPYLDRRGDASPDSLPVPALHRLTSMSRLGGSSNSLKGAVEEEEEQEIEEFLEGERDSLE